MRMIKVSNILNEDILVPNVKVAAYFILFYEHFEDVVINTVKEFFSYDSVLDGKLYSSIGDDYIKALKKKINNEESGGLVSYKHCLDDALRGKKVYEEEILKSEKTFKGSLKWLQKYGVITKSEEERILEVRKRRNDIVHELLKVLGEGLTDKDAQMIADLMGFNQRINNWRFQQIDMPVMEVCLPDGVAAEDVVSGDDMILMSIFRILFCDEGKEFKEALDKELNKNSNVNGGIEA